MATPARVEWGPNDLLTTQQASDVLQVTTRTLERWREGGAEGPPYRHMRDRTVRYRHHELQAWIDRHAVRPTPSPKPKHSAS